MVYCHHNVQFKLIKVHGSISIGDYEVSKCHMKSTFQRTWRIPRRVNIHCFTTYAITLDIRFTATNSMMSQRAISCTGSYKWRFRLEPSNRWCIKACPYPGCASAIKEEYAMSQYARRETGTIPEGKYEIRVNHVNWGTNQGSTLC